MPVRVTERRVLWHRYAAVAVGAFLGTLSRYGLSLMTDGGPGPSSGLGAGEWVTAGVNTAGALILGMLTGLWAVGRGPGSRSSWVRAGLGPGFLGAFTTFSALSLTLVHPFRPVDVLAQPVVGLVAAGLGLLWGRRFAPRGGAE